MYKLSLIVLLSLILSACSGGGGGGTSPGPTGGNNPPAEQGVYGLAAEGAPLANTIVLLKDAQGVTKQTTTDSDGKFSFVAGGISFPALIKVGNQYSVAYSQSYLNVTPFTTLTLSTLIGSPSVAFNSYPTSPNPTVLGSEEDFTTAEQIVVGKLNSVIDISSLSLLTQQFSPTLGDVYDDLLEELKDYLSNQMISFDSFVGYFVEEESETVLQCIQGQHLNTESLSCEDNTQSCDIDFGQGERTWTVSGWGSCMRTSCDEGYIENQSNGCSSEENPEEPGSGNEEEYQAVSLTETSFNQMASVQLEKQIGEGTVIVSKVGAGSPGPQSAYLFDTTGVSPLKIKLSAEGEYIDLNSNSITRKGDKFVFYVDRLYVAEGKDSVATAIDSKIRQNYLHAIFRSGDKVFMILEDNNPDNGNQLENFMYELDLNAPTLALTKVSEVSSNFLNLPPKFIGVDDQGKILFQKEVLVNGAASEIQFYSFNPNTKSLDLLVSYSTASATRNFRFSSQSMYLDGMEMGFIKVNGRYVRPVEIKNGSTWEPKMLVLGRGEGKVLALKTHLIPHVRVVNNQTLAYRTSFYQQSDIMEAVALFSPDTGESIAWSQKASALVFSPTFVMTTTSVQGVVAGPTSVYALIKEDTSENSVTTTKNKIIKIDQAGVSSVLFSDLTPSVKTIMNSSPGSTSSINFATMAYLKGGVVMNSYGDTTSATLYRLRLDNGEMEVIKNDFYYNTYDSKSINRIFKLNSFNKIIVAGEDSTTNGIYTKMFILE